MSDLIEQLRLISRAFGVQGEWSGEEILGLVHLRHQYETCPEQFASATTDDGAASWWPTSAL